MRIPFSEFIKDNLVLFDGAIGTELYNKGIFINSCYDELNLSRTKLIKEIHEDYVTAGADVLETNTFGANRLKLQKFGLEDKVYDINFKGAQIAREAAGEDVYVAGSIGPLNERLEPWGPLSEAEAKEIFIEQAKALVDGGIDLFILETFSDLHLIQQAILALKENFDLLIMAQMTIGNDGNSLFGTPPELFASKMSQWGADIVGINCSVGPKPMLDALEKMNEVVDIPISIMPNAGTPVNVEGRNIYLSTADYFSEYTRRFIHAGATIVGGCCGTNPTFIREMRKSIQSIQPRKIVQKHIKVTEEQKPVSRASSLFFVAYILFMTSSGTFAPGTSLFINSALRTLTKGHTPAISGILRCSVRFMKLYNSSLSKTGCVMAYSAPAFTFHSNRRIS